ncbi:MAG: hypothetical protein DMG78_31435 [Acidobacteria bacterium]|nr:MAG: hypothetical protein DMG78_31435 [Acidobacteriota bacterium]
MAKGVGSALLKDALMRTAGAADTIGARALLVHARDDDANPSMSTSPSRQVKVIHTIYCSL